MNKTELVAAVAEKAEISKKDADSAVNAVIESIIEAVASKDKVQIVGFGTFEARERKEKIGKNPRTGEEIKIAASKVPAFKAGKALKDAVKEFWLIKPDTLAFGAYVRLFLLSVLELNKRFSGFEKVD